MGVIKTIVFVFISLFVSFFYTLEASATSVFSDLESNISPESNTQKIEKLQTLFTQLGLYTGEIDGNYESIAPALINFQIAEGIVQHKDDWGAGYFWIKTLEVLEKKYEDEFHDNKHIIQQETPDIEERYFYVTAYYSPLPGQKRYTTGSYAWDLRLNGKGTHTASWKGVYTGILAAPRNYAFGTKIYLEWIGVWAVEDRWWAIVNAGERWHEYDRIDVWMWYGDEWLARALKWGKRKVKGKIVDERNQVSIQFDQSPVAQYMSLRVSEESEVQQVKKLQELFQQIDLYNGSVDGNYASIKDELIAYQVDNWIIPSRYSEQAGYFWPKTLGALISQFGWGIFEADTTQLLEDEILLSRKQSLEIYTIKKKIDTYLHKKYEWNKLKIYAYKKKVRNRLDSISRKSKSEVTKAKIKYLKSIL